MTILPFSIAFISNAGASSDGAYVDSMEANEGEFPNSWWLYNGGANRTADYRSIFPSYPIEWESCAHIVESWCVGNSTAGTYRMVTSTSTYAVDWKLPSTASEIWQSHYLASDGSSYLGDSGTEKFGWHLNSSYFPNIEQNQAIDRLKFTYVDRNIDYVCDYSEFANITFQGEITFIHNGKSKVYRGFEFDTDNKYSYRNYDNQNGHWNDVCQVGFETEFDFTGFESLDLQSFNMGDWQNTTIELILENFERKDSRNFANTPLPFAGDNTFTFSIEHQEVNSIQAGFIIRTGTLALSLGIVALAVASTKQWNPFTSFIGGLLP